MLLSLVIPTHDAINHIGRCLDSVFSQRSTEIEVIVVDDGSIDSTAHFVNKTYPLVRLARNDKNMGSSFSRNKGIDMASGKYVMLMDSDAYLAEDFIAKMEPFLRSLPDNIVAVSPKIIYAHSDKVFSCGLNISSIYRVYDIGRGMHGSKLNKSFFIDGPNSCCAIYRKDILGSIKEKNGYFDDTFFFLFEDADLALRLKEKGYLSTFFPHSICFHSGGGSGFSREFRRYLCFRNRWYMIVKRKHGARVLLRSLPYDLIRTLHFALTNRYFFACLRQIHRRAVDEKSPHI